MLTIPWKEWLYEEADRMKITKPALENRIRRKQHHMPPHRMINSRNIEVLVPEVGDSCTSIGGTETVQITRVDRDFVHWLDASNGSTGRMLRAHFFTFYQPNQPS